LAVAGHGPIEFDTVPFSSVDHQPSLISGSLVNFESPPVEPLALSADGSILYATNTPKGVLSVLAVADGLLSLVDEIPVGIDPIAVALEPGSDAEQGGRHAWVANFLSDNVSVVDLELGQTIAVIPTPDEPANILIDAAGTTAFVVCQSGELVAIDVATRSEVGRLKLDGFNPRAAVFRGGELAIAALHSGNNTTVVGTPALLEFAEGPSIVLPTLAIAQRFEATAELFEHPLLSPWPDRATLVNEESPLVLRIVPDAGVTVDNPWRAILDVIDGGSGTPRPEIVQQLEDQLARDFGRTPLNVGEVLQSMIDEYVDTRDHDLLLIEIDDPSSMQQRTAIGGIGTTLHGLAIDPVSGDLWVTNLEARNLVRLEPSLRGHFVDHEVVRVQEVLEGEFLVEPHDLHVGVPGDFNDVSVPNPDAQSLSLAHAVDLVVSDDGARIYTASLGTDRVGVLDGATGEVLSVVDVGAGPRALLLEDANERIYTFNRGDLSITTLDVSSDIPVVIGQFSLPNPEPAELYTARRFLYSARFSNNFGSSCAMCHIDGLQDHLAWDLGDRGAELQPAPAPFEDSFNHPVKGPMVTQALAGLRGHAPYHWRGDRPTFEDFNPAFDSLLGGQAIPAADMAEFTQFIETIEYPPGRARARDNSFLDPRAREGELVFLSGCNNCHRLAHDGAQIDPKDIGRGDLAGEFPADAPEFQFGRIQLMRQLRGVYK